LNDREKIEKMAKKSKELSNVNAAKKIIDVILDKIKET